jgi:hypothetical protein
MTEAKDSTELIDSAQTILGWWLDKRVSSFDIVTSDQALEVLCNNPRTATLSPIHPSSVL